MTHPSPTLLDAQPIPPVLATTSTNLVTCTNTPATASSSSTAASNDLRAVSSSSATVDLMNQNDSFEELISQFTAIDRTNEKSTSKQFLIKILPQKRHK